MFDMFQKTFFKIVVIVGIVLKMYVCKKISSLKLHNLTVFYN